MNMRLAELPERLTEVQLGDVVQKKESDTVARVKGVFLDERKGTWCLVTSSGNMYEADVEKIDREDLTESQFRALE